MTQRQYSSLEQDVGDLWHRELKKDMLEAGSEERRLAMERNDYHEGVPSITVICDGGWSKRCHKHTYNALGGVGVIFGAVTGKLLHIGVRNEHCYVCSWQNQDTVIQLHISVSKTGMTQVRQWRQTSLLMDLCRLNLHMVYDTCD